MKKQRIQSTEKILNKLLELLDIKDQETKNFRKEILIENITKIKKENKILKDNIILLQNEVLFKSKEKYSSDEKLFKIINNYSYDKKNSSNIIDILKNKLENKEYSIELQKFNIESKNDTIKKVKLDNTLTINENNQLKLDINLLKDEILKHKSRIFELENKLDNIYIERKSESSLIIENEHLKYDNLRLLDLLITTKEYQNFSYLKNDYLTDAIIYTGNSFDLKNNSKEIIFSKNKNMENLKYYKNDLNWISLYIYNKVIELFEKYKVNFHKELVNEIIYFLNCSWKEREKNSLILLKNKHKREKEEILRKQNYIK